jgi:hypothetical protein
MPDKPHRRTNHTDSQANTEIDRRLAEAIKERTKLHAQVSKLYSAQERLGRVEQEINSLVHLQKQLDGTAVSPIPMPSLQTAPPYSGHATEMPPGVGSIPTREPKGTTANAGPALKAEGGFV